MQIVNSSALLLLSACQANRGGATPELVKERLLREGYRQTFYKGQFFYRRDEIVAGSQFAERVWLTEERI